MLDQAHTILYVDDIERCARFYRDVLGLPVQSIGDARAQIEIRGLSLVLLPRGDSQPREAGPVHVALDVEDVDETYRRLSSQSVVFSVPPAETALGKQATMCDPDGTPIDLIEWSKPHDDAVSNHTVVNDILLRSPDAIEVLEEHGIRICGGCIVLLNGTVQETADYSGLSRAESARMLQELNTKLGQST